MNEFIYSIIVSEGTLLCDKCLLFRLKRRKMSENGLHFSWTDFKSAHHRKAGQNTQQILQ